MSARIEDLEPVTRGLCKALLARWEEGMHPPIRVTHTLRTFDEQQHLYAKGRTMPGVECHHSDGPRAVGTCTQHPLGLPVTKAAPGSSAHNYGAAFDICFVGADPYLQKHVVDHGMPDPLWRLLGETGTKLGLNWGGPLGVDDRFTWDSPHFERRDWKTLIPQGGT